jgi:subtilisin family serine protease
MRLSLAMIALVVGVSGAGARTLAGDGGLHRYIGGVNADAEFVPGEVIVQFRPGASGAARSRVLAARGAHAVRTLGQPGLTLVRLRGGASVRAAAASFERDASVAFAEPNYLYRLTGPPNDQDFGLLWGLHDPVGDHDIDAPEAWDTQTGSSNVVVAVIDSGVAYDHPELNDNIWVNPDEIPGNGVDDDGNGRIDDVRGWDFIQNDNAPLDFYGHGTHVAGTIGAEGNNNADIAGVNWDVSIMAVRAGDANGSLPGTAILNAINYACGEHADIVNGSFGGPGKSQTIANAIKSNACKNTLFVFAAGNDGANLTNNTNSTNAYPCEYHRPSPHGFSVPNIICVAATNQNDALARFSNRGKAAVHLAAPGVGIYSSLPEWTALFSDDLETSFNNWTQAGGTAAWARTSEMASSGSFSMTDSPGGNYANNQNYTIRNNAALKLTGQVGCVVDYDLELLMRDFNSSTVFDWFAIERATNTAGPWTEIGFYFGDSVPPTGPGGFVALTDDLSALDGQGTVYFRFLVHTDSSVRDGGAHVDDVVVRCLVANGEDYAMFQGTSMATPHVVGVAALLLAQEPAMNPAKLKNAILKGVDKKSGLVDRVSTAGRLNANGSLAIAMDDVPPNTTITDRPPNRTSNRKATFKFTSSEAGSTFQCKHMNGAWRACSSPKTYTNLNKGLHTFQVRAIDMNLNVDPTPAVDTWRIR